MAEDDDKIMDKVMEIGGGMSLRKDGKGKYALEFPDFPSQSITPVEAANLIMQCRIANSLKDIERRIAKKLPSR